MRTMIGIKYAFVGYHCWPNAPRGHFLADKHRHVFVVRAKVEVKHDDREVEFFELQKQVAHIYPGEVTLGGLSCEDIAKVIVEHLEYMYGSDRCIEVAVSEDDENWAEVSNAVLSNCTCGRSSES